MFRYNILFFIRSLKRHRLFTLLNIGGLTLGMAAFIYMMDYAAYEESFDDYRPDHERIFRISSQKTQDGLVQDRRSSASVYLAPFIEETFQGLESVVRVHILDNARQTVIVNENGTRSKFEETRGFHAGSNYFKIFSDELIAGNSETAFNEPFNMVLTASLSIKYFGTTDALGKTVTLVDDESREYVITGIVKDIPSNSHFQYDYLISLKTLQTLWPRARWNSWNWDYFHTYVKVSPGTNIEELENRINAAVAENGKDIFASGNYSMDFEFQNIRDVHLYSNLGRELSSNGNGELLGYIYIIASFVLILAWVNYINLATATSSLRAKEVGIRKVSGARKASLVRQFLIESFLINFLSLTLATIIVVLSSDLLKEYTAHEFSYLVFTDPQWIEVLVGIVLLGSITSGLYPAFVLSRFQPVKVVKGNFTNSRQGIALRKTLVVFQFAISLMLMIGTAAIYSQVSFLRSRDLGIELDQVLAVSAPNIRTDQVWPEFDYLKNKALENSGISMMSASNMVPGNVLYHTELFKRREQNITEAKVASMVWVDYDFLDLYGLELLAGKDFIKGHSDNERGMIINQSTAKLMGFQTPEDAIDQPATWVHSFGDLTDVKIIGVINDFDQRPMGTAQPMAMLMNRHFRWTEMNYYLYKIQTNEINETLAGIQSDYETTYPNESFNAFFVNEQFNQKYQSEAKFGDVFSLFSLIAILISNLGLFGLTYFVLTQRKKEISIRKVLGASVSHLITLISKQFITQILIASVVGIPLVYYGLNQWLDRFAYRMDFSVLLFLVPFVALLAIAFLTTFWQTSRAAQANPVTNLRNE